MWPRCRVPKQITVAVQSLQSPPLLTYCTLKVAHQECGQGQVSRVLSAAGGDRLYCTAGAGPGGSLEWLLDEPGFSEEEEGFFILMKRASIIINLWQRRRGGRSRLGLPGAWLRRSSWLQRADVCRTPRPLAAAPKPTRPPHGRRSCSRTSTRLSPHFPHKFLPAQPLH
jgi:hypothetical protein